MSEISDRFVVVLDANVLYPFRVRDTLLRFAEAGLFRARWSSQIIDEWVQSLLAEKPHLKISLQSQVKAMATVFPEAMIDGHQSLISALELPDENDRHVLALAIFTGAQHIVTENLRDFPEKVLEPYCIKAVSADAILAGTYELYPGEATKALRKMRKAYRNPPMNVSEFVTDLMRVGLGRTAAMARQRIDFL